MRSAPALVTGAVLFGALGARSFGDNPTGCTIGAMPDWDDLTTDTQVRLARSAIQLAAAILARHADALAEQMENGTLDNRSGREALRLLAMVMRFATPKSGGPGGRA
jgi:hypothetical protein